MSGGHADDMKLTLSELEQFRSLLTVMERFESSNQTALMNSVADLIVLLLTGGDCSSIVIYNISLVVYFFVVTTMYNSVFACSKQVEW